jgi:hypothetical protein
MEPTMRNRIRHLRWPLTVGVALAVVVAAAPAAHAAPNPYTPQGVCGSGYSVIDQQPISTGLVWATVYLLWNGGNGNNCVVTIKRVNVGTPTYTAATLETPSGKTTDAGSFRYYAGPVKRYARGICVRWGGVASDTAGQRFAVYSGWEHCGG